MVQRKLSSRSWGAWILIAVVALYMIVLIVGPLGRLVFGAFEDGVAPLVEAFGDPVLLGAFWRTIVLTVATVVIHGILGTAVAFVLVRHEFPGKRLLNGIIDLPFAVSPVIVGYMLILLFGRRGLLTPITDSLGISVAFALPGMLLATLFVTLPFMIRELVPVLQAFGVGQEEAAATLGASGWQTFRRVTFPALRWGFLYGLGLTCARALGEFGAVLVVSGSIQGRTETATLYIYRSLDDRQYAGAYGAALVLGCVSLALVLAIEWRQSRRNDGLAH